MPNSRDPKKTRVAVWLLPSEIRALKALAKRSGTSMSDVVKVLIARAKK